MTHHTFSSTSSKTTCDTLCCYCLENEQEFKEFLNQSLQGADFNQNPKDCLLGYVMILFDYHFKNRDFIRDLMEKMTYESPKHKNQLFQVFNEFVERTIRSCIKQSGEHDFHHLFFRKDRPSTEDHEEDFLFLSKMTHYFIPPYLSLTFACKIFTLAFIRWLNVWLKDHSIDQEQTMAQVDHELSLFFNYYAV